MNDSQSNTRSFKTLWTEHKTARLVAAFVGILLWVLAFNAWIYPSKADAAPAPAQVTQSAPAIMPSCHMGIGGTWIGYGCTNSYAKAGALQTTSNYATAGRCAGAAAIGGFAGPLAASASFGTCLWLSAW